MDIITIPLGEHPELEVYPLADVHLGDPKTDEEMFKAFAKNILKEDNRFIIINGDLINNAIKTSVSNPYNEKYSPDEQKDMMTDYLMPLKDRILCMVPGNHEERSSKETDCHIIKDIAYRINKKDRYRENGAYINIQFGRDRHGRKLSYAGYIVHGKGGGKKVGSGLAVLQDVTLICDADFYVMGHIHHCEGGKLVYLKPNSIWTKLERFERALVISRPWQDYGGYAQRFLYSPQVKGAKPIILSGRTKDMEIRL
jgi:hypothetical protein